MTASNEEAAIWETLREEPFDWFADEAFDCY